MLIWLNGAFGAGKTQTAHELDRRLPDGHVADPELLGFALHRMLPTAQRRDFQDLAQWRSGVVETLAQAERAHRGPVLVPMTLVEDDYFDEIMDGLTSRAVAVRHYALLAEPSTLRNRLSHRLGFIGSWIGDDTWAVEQIPRCVAALATERYATHVETDNLTTDEVVEWIACDAGLTLTRPRLGPLRSQLQRLRVGVRHVRA